MPFAELTIGQLRQRITLQRRVESGDGQGGATVGWVLIDVVWAAVDDTDGREALLREGLLTAQSSTAVTIRYRTDISVKDRIVWGARVLDIASISDVDGRRRFQRLLCMEVQNGPAAITEQLDPWVDSQLV